MSPRRRRMTAAEVVSVLRSRGFDRVSQKGSHHKWRHESQALQVIVPEHRGRQLPLGTLRSILLGAEIPEAEWRG